MNTGLNNINLLSFLYF